MLDIPTQLKNDHARLLTQRNIPSHSHNQLFLTHPLLDIIFILEQGKMLTAWWTKVAADNYMIRVVIDTNEFFEVLLLVIAPVIKQ